MSEVEHEGRPVALRQQVEDVYTPEERAMIAEMREKQRAAAQPVPAESPRAEDLIPVHTEAAEAVALAVQAPAVPVVADPVPASVAPVAVAVEPEVAMILADEPAAIKPPVAEGPREEESDAPAEEEKKQTVYLSFPCRVDPAVAQSKEFSELLKANMLLEVPGLSSFRFVPNLVQSEFDKLMEGASFDPVEERVVYVSPEQEDAANQIGVSSYNHAPIYLHGRTAQEQAMMREGVTWDQRLKLPDGSAMALVRSHGNQDVSTLGRLRRAKGGGVPVTLFMPSSGFYVTYRTPHEREFCDVDLQFAAETSLLGMATYGLLMSASSGVYMRHLIDAAMGFVTATSLNVEGKDMTTSVLAALDMQDAMLFILGPIIAKYPGGLPWELICPMADCGDSRELQLNLSRCIRPGNGLYANTQLDFIVRTRGKQVTQAQIQEYKGYATTPETHQFNHTLPQGGSVKVTWGHSTALEYFNHATNWIETNNTITTAAMMEHATEDLRERHLRIVADQRRLLRNIHFVKAVEVIDADGSTSLETEIAKIIPLLEELSEDRLYINAFEAALANYIEDCRLFVVGYMADTCPSCQRSGGEQGDKTFRGMIPLAPDRIFFTLSRVVSGTQRQLAEVYDNIG